jgi:hypothetical protein
LLAASIGTSQMLTAARNASGPRSQRAPPPDALRGCHFSLRRIANGIKTSSGRNFTPFVITPSPAAAQPIVYQRHDGPRSRWRSNPYKLSVVQKHSVASICACRACHTNCTVNNSASAPANPVSRFHKRRPRS